MRSLRDLFGKGSEEPPIEVPSWAGFMSPDRFAVFKRITESEIRKHYPSAQIDWSAGSWKDSSTGGSFGFLNLAQLANNCPANELPDLVADFIDSLAEHFGKSPQNLSFEEARSILKVRLFHPDVPLHILVTAPYCDSFLSALVLDHPKTVQNVRPELPKEWGIPVHELFKIGLENVLAQDSFEMQRAGPSPEVALTLLHGPSFFVSTHALLLDRHIGFDEDSGLLVIVPHRHITAFHQVGKAIAPIIPDFAEFAENLYKEGPGSITTDILWFRRGQFEKVTMQAGKVVAPAPLANLLY